jgi:hypothetical protein
MQQIDIANKVIDEKTTDIEGTKILHCQLSDERHMFTCVSHPPPRKMARRWMEVTSFCEISDVGEHREYIVSHIVGIPLEIVDSDNQRRTISA